ncbi:MAG TPA: ATP-binding protein [Thermoleophilaceae bacterium]|nr:ATP-binding protein [Thermoleophilaceae bacterium]
MADKLSLSFPREPDSVPAARATLAQFEDRVGAAALYDASLCLSELVTNAVQHPDAAAGDELELELTLREDVLRVEVIDPGGDFHPDKPTEGDERGWGLFIVDQLSSRWGTNSGSDRTIMWFEVTRDDSATAVIRGEGAARIQ